MGDLQTAIPQTSQLGFRELPGRETEMTCPCGGVLQEVRFIHEPAGPPWHRKKRIRKKWRKCWEKEVYPRVMASAILMTVRPPSYRCTSCGRSEGLYSAVGRNLIKVEPLPEDARQRLFGNYED